jgi:hypothetical protein
MIWAIDNTWMNWGWCPKDNASILYAENDYHRIVNFINNVRLHDGTATHVGMKYGVALLNPSSRDVFRQLADRGVIADDYRNRPADWEDDVVKYIVLMTDGNTTPSSGRGFRRAAPARIHPGARTGTTARSTASSCRPAACPATPRWSSPATATRAAFPRA